MGELNKIEEVLSKLLKERDAEALLISATVAQQINYYPKAFIYAQTFVEAHGNSPEMMMIKANSALKMYRDFPNESNKNLLKQVADQLSKLDQIKRSSIIRIQSSILLELGEINQAYQKAKAAKDNNLIKAIDTIRLKNELKKQAHGQWPNHLSNYQNKFSQLELTHIQISALIEEKKYTQAQKLLNENDDMKSKQFKIILYHLNKNYIERDQLVEKLDLSEKIWCLLAQISYRQKDFANAAKCFKKALNLAPDQLIISNNYITCLLQNGDKLDSTQLVKASENYKKFPQKETLNTLVAVLQNLNKNEQLKTLLESQRSLSLKHELILAEIYQNSSPSKAQALIVRVLSTQGKMLDEDKKIELKEWLKVCKSAP